MELEEIKKQLDENTQRIVNNIEKISNNADKIQENSYALEILRDYKAENTRLYEINKKLIRVIILLVFLLVASVCYLVYILNDIDYVDERTQEVDTSSIEYSDIINGDAYGKD